jgi:NAD(P)H-dependent FMN reductase
MAKIVLIVGSVRQERQGIKVARWMEENRNYKSQRSKISNQKINNQQYRSLAQKRATASEYSKS